MSKSEYNTEINEQNFSSMWSIVISTRLIKPNLNIFNKHVPGEIIYEQSSKGRRKNFSDLFFYNQKLGTAALFTTDGQGNISLVKEYNNLKEWDIIVAGRFTYHDLSDLFFYNQKLGTAALFTTDGQGNISLVKEYNNLKEWDIIVAGRFTYHDLSDLFFYNQKLGTAALFTTDGQGNISLVKEYNNLKEWDIIVAGRFTYHDLSDLFFYNQKLGTAALFTTDGQGNISLVKEYNNLKEWDIIICGAFRNYYYIFSDLFFYNQKLGTAALFTTDGQGNISLVKEYNNLKEWHVLSSGELLNSINHDSVFMYNNLVGKISFCSFYVPRPLVFSVKPVMYRENEPIKVTIFFLDEGLEYKMEVEDPQGYILDKFISTANGSLADMHTFYITSNQKMQREKYKINFYLKEDVFKLIHIENIFHSPN